MRSWGKFVVTIGGMGVGVGVWGLVGEKCLSTPLEDVFLSCLFGIISFEKQNITCPTKGRKLLPLYLDINVHLHIDVGLTY